MASSASTEPVAGAERPVSFRCPPELYARLAAVAAKEDRSLSAVLRRAAETYCRLAEARA